LSSKIESSGHFYVTQEINFRHLGNEKAALKIVIDG